MKIRSLLCLGAAVVLVGCGEKESATPEPAAETAAAPEAEVTIAEPEIVVDEAFLAHMHDHAEKLDDINFALADGNLEAAKSPAYWLSAHDTVKGIPSAWEPYVTGMREAAALVETAADLETARAAADRITQNCQACHEVAGIFLE